MCKPYFYIYNHFAAHICSICYVYHLGVLVGVLFFPGGLGVVVLDLTPDWGVLCLPALPGVQWVLARVDRKSLFMPLCLVVLLQARQVAIWENNRSDVSVWILIVKIVLVQQSDAWSTANGARWWHRHSYCDLTAEQQITIQSRRNIHRADSWGFLMALPNIILPFSIFYRCENSCGKARCCCAVLPILSEESPVSFARLILVSFFFSSEAAGHLSYIYSCSTHLKLFLN